MGDKIDPTAIMNTLFVTISVKLLAHSFSAACRGLWVVQPSEPSECCAFSETQVMSRRSQQLELLAVRHSNPSPPSCDLQGNSTVQFILWCAVSLTS
jgi:hypothetical protein